MQRLGEGEVQADLARSYGVSQSTISRLSVIALSRPARPPPSKAVSAGQPRQLGSSTISAIHCAPPGQLEAQARVTNLHGSWIQSAHCLMLVAYEPPFCLRRSC